jgi:ATP-binding protein involved in chromosome partitioning
MKEKRESAVDRDILELNVDFNCGRWCESCEKFFDCDDPKRLQIYERRRMQKAKQSLSTIKYKIPVAGGKGGVGKSITTANLGMGLTMRGHKVTILDQDFDGSCIPKMLGITDKRMEMCPEGLLPIEGPLGINVLSMGNILKTEDVLTWFHDMRRGATEEFMSHTLFGERDFLLVDLPPGTSSDTVNTLQFLSDATGMVVVTIPSQVSQGVAYKAVMLAKKAGIRILGIIENMSGYVCEECGSIEYIFQKGGGELLAEEADVPFLGKIPLDGRLTKASDKGTPFVHAFAESEASKSVNKIIDRILVQLEDSVQRKSADSTALAEEAEERSSTR